jgi:hypothetical protein
MAITYDYTYNIVGDALGAVNNTASTSVNLTGLTTGEDYVVSVRQRREEGGIVYLSIADSETFTPVVSSVVVDLSQISTTPVIHPISLSLPISVSLGALSYSTTLNSIAAYTPLLVDSYNIKLHHVEGVSDTDIENVLTNSYGLTGLITDDNYEVSVQTVERISGVGYPTLYSDAVAFASIASNAVGVDLGTISSSVSLNSVGAITDNTVRIDLGVITTNTTLNSVTASGSVIGNLGLIASIASLNSISAYQPGTPIYTLRLQQDGEAASEISGIIGNSYNLTGLLLNETYTVSVIAEDNGIDYSGVTYFLPYSDTLTFLSEARPTISVGLGHLIPDVLTLHEYSAYDRFFLINNLSYSQASGDFELSGSATLELQSMAITVDGNPMTVTLNGSLFDATLEAVPLFIKHADELDGYQPLSAGNQLLEVG